MADAPATNEVHFVVGGVGFLGSSIVRLLLARGEKHVVVFDIRAPTDDERKLASPTASSARPEYVTGDLTSSESVSSALRKAASDHASTPDKVVVYHTASPVAGRGAEVYEKVNVEGTRTLLSAAKATGVRKFVYTSSAGVIFTGDDLVYVDESLPYPLVPMDAYNDTKARAEKEVLAANQPEESGFKTCALRPAGIFGVGDRQALPGFFNVLATGKTGWQIGDNLNLFDWTYVDNVAHAHLLAADKLLLPLSQQYDTKRLGLEHLSDKIADGNDATRYRPPPTSLARPSPPGVKDYAAEMPERSGLTAAVDPAGQEWGLNQRPVVRNKYDPLFHHQHPTEVNDANPSPLVEGANLARPYLGVAGEAFFITNGQPIPFWDFPRALWKRVGHVDPPGSVRTLSKSVGQALGFASEWWSWLVGKDPLFTRYKVTYTASARYYNIEKARRVLGYEPVVPLEEGITRSADWWASIHPEVLQSSTETPKSG